MAELSSTRQPCLVSRTTVQSFPQVSECPECRQPYPGRPRRHRYAERAAKELEGLRRERGQILGD